MHFVKACNDYLCRQRHPITLDFSDELFYTLTTVSRVFKLYFCIFVRGRGSYLLWQSLADSFLQ